jgi:PAS domain S-box-containing protein
MTMPEAQSTPLITALEQLGPHDHLCSIYENQEEQFSVAIPFIRIGLDRGEKCVYVADDGTEDVVCEAMHAEGIDVERAVASRALVLTTKKQTYLKRGCFNPDWMFTFWKEATVSAISEGFPALRATGETEWILRGALGCERWIEYESRATHALSESNCLVLCQYNRRILPPELILEIIRTHPIVVYHGAVCRNLYYVPPDEFLGAKHAEREVERLLTNIRERERVESELREQAAELIEHKRAEEELRRSEAYLAEGQRLSHTGSWAWNVSTGELFWSQEHFRIFGLDPEKAKPSYEMFFEMVHPEDRRFIERSLDMAVRERSDFNNDYRIVRPDGMVRHIHSLAHPVFNQSGDLTEYVGTVIDTTEHVRARATLSQALEEIDNLKERLHHENVALKEEIDRTSMFEEIVGSSPAVKSVLSRVAKVAPMDSTVLIAGETGTGKELIARAIHKRSKRANRAFVAFNCAGIPPTLIASELFGHEKGAFTGAQQRRLGRFELAAGGTIFLDEIGELPAETQIALLRVLQEREFERVGGSQPISIDVRVITASNRDLQDAIAAGTFRLDLFHRLNVFPIEVPPLRERKEDIPILLEYFIKRYSDKAGKTIRSIDKKTVDLFRSYSWPGNIRELQNVIERSMIVCESEIFSVDESWLSRASQPHRSSSTLAESLHEEEKKIIETALAESKGRIAGGSGAATRLGIPSSTLESKIKLLKIKKNQFKPD